MRSHWPMPVPAAHIYRSAVSVAAALFAITAVAVGGMPEARAQATNTIVAVVNGEAVTSFDLEQRIKILLLSSGLPDTPEQRSALEQRVIQTLVDERLKMQEAERLGVSLTGEEFSRSVANVERGNNLPEGGLDEFARRNGISPKALEAQIRADLTWQKLIMQTERDRIEISDEQIEDVMTRVEASEGETEYHVVELLLLTDERAGVTKQDARELAERLVQQIRGGASFANVATQFSDSPSATRGGDLGWLLASEMSPSMAAVVPNMSLGSISDPIEEDRGYRIYGLVNRRLANATVTSDTEVAVRLYVLPLPSEPSEAAVREKVEEANRIRSSIGSCEEFKSRAAAGGTPQPPSPTRLRLGDVNPQVRTIIASLGVGQISEPLPSPVGVQLIMVCDREITTDMPSRAEIQDNLLRERIEVVSRRRLRDLRRAAYIEYR